MLTLTEDCVITTGIENNLTFQSSNNYCQLIQPNFDLTEDDNIIRMDSIIKLDQEIEIMQKSLEEDDLK